MSDDKRGIIYVMRSAIPGLVKIGKCGTKQYEDRMRNLESNGYRNVTGLKRAFAIEVDNYDAKEILIHTIFAKSQVGNTELFAINVNLAIEFLSALDGEMKYHDPDFQTKDDVFTEAAEITNGKVIPDGEYTFERHKKSDNRDVKATAVIKNGYWTLKKDSILGSSEDTGASNKAKRIHENMNINKEDGRLKSDFELGECSPSLAARVVLLGSSDGWREWKDKDGNKIEIYRQKETEE